jgi:hypothetical protein
MGIGKPRVLIFVRGSDFDRHPGAGRKRFSTAGWLVIQSLGVWLSRGRNLARLPRASVLLPEAGLLFFACPKKSNQKKGPPG